MGEEEKKATIHSKKQHNNSGDTIQAITLSTDVNHLKPMLTEGDTYVMQSFKVLPNDLPAKVSNHPFKIILGSAASIKRKEMNNIPTKQFSFHSFQSILQKKIMNDCLVDVIGGIAEILFFQNSGDKRKASFVLTDLDGQTLNCTLWGDFATTLITYYNNRKDESENIVLILTHAKIKESQGKYPISISNWWYGSKLFINDNISEIENFKKKFPTKAIVARQTMSMSQYTGESQYSQGNTKEDKFLRGAQIMNLGKINTLNEDVIAITVATIGRIEPLSTGWCYDGCTQCYKRTVKKGDNFECLDGHVSLRPNKKYKIEVTVLDNKSRSKFLLWDTDVSNTLGISADDLLKKMLDEGEDDEKAYPLDIDMLLGKTAAFKVKAGPRNRTSSVSWMWSDPNVIEKISALISPQEENSVCQTGKFNTVSEQKHHSITQETNSVSQQESANVHPTVQTHSTTTNEYDISATSEFDPKGQCKTPAKRLHPDPITPEPGSAQLSTTKPIDKKKYEPKRKLIKKEKD